MLIAAIYCVLCIHNFIDHIGKESSMVNRNTCFNTELLIGEEGSMVLSYPSSHYSPHSMFYTILNFIPSDLGPRI